jgi:hypothetical protein
MSHSGKSKVLHLIEVAKAKVGEISGKPEESAPEEE